MAISSRGARHPPGVARLSLSTHRAEPIPLVRALENLLSGSAVDRVGPTTEALGKVRSLSVAEGSGI
jgi:hypothetical protein